MAFKSALILLACLGFCSAGSSNRIVGGKPTTVENYPSIVQIEFRGVWSGIWSQSCAGTILTSVHILSAAHCFYGQTFLLENRRIRAGTSNRNVGGQVVELQWARNHPEYNQAASFNHDIVVLRTATPLVFSHAVQQGAIPPQGFQAPDNSPVVHAGWGAIYWEGPASQVLLDVTLYTVNNALCKERYANKWPFPGIVTENMICAGILNVGGADACQGDSGGPLYYGNVTMGIVSWGHQCAHATYPGVSTAVSSYTNWIVANAI